MTGLGLQVFGLSILRDKPTPGMALLNLRFRSELASDQTSQSASGLPSEPLPAQASDWTADLAADTGEQLLKNELLNLQARFAACPLEGIPLPTP